MNIPKKLKFKISSLHFGLLVLVLSFAFMIKQEVKKISVPWEYKRSFAAQLERTLFDYRISSRGTRPTSQTVGILAIDEKSIAKYGRWPFPRSSYTDAFRNLKTAGVKWIGLDVLFTEPENMLLADALEPMEGILSRSLSPTGLLNPQQFAAGVFELLNKSPGDQSLGSAIQAFGNVIQATAFLPREAGVDSNRNWSAEREALVGSLLLEPQKQNQIVSEDLFPLVNTETIRGPSPQIGIINNETDSDGIFRRAQLAWEVESLNEQNQIQKNYLPSLSLALASKFLGRNVAIISRASRNEIILSKENEAPISIPTIDHNFNVHLNHYGRHFDDQQNETPPRISLADAADNILPENLPQILIMGSTTLGIDDKRPSPIDPLANGVEHHVAATENIIQRDFLYRSDYSFINELILLMASGLLLCLLLAKANAMTALSILVSTHIAIELIYNLYFFPQGIIFHLGIFHIQNAAIFLAMIMFKFFVEEREKRQVKSAFQHYLNPEVINQVVSAPEKLKLGGDKQNLTVFFSDVRGFTSISEIMSPEALTKLLNEYFTPMTNIVLESKGLLDKYIGDALMAVWGAPAHIADHADRALASALKMLDELDVLREKWKSENLPPIDIGCGINTGPMVVGNMGSQLRFDYTVLGDSVNLGARLEGITKEYGVRIICSEFTKQNLVAPQNFLLRELDWIRVKGKSEPVTIFEVMRFNESNKEKRASIKEIFEAGLALYRKKEFDKASTEMIRVLQIDAQDGPASVFLERCEHFTKHPPSHDWSGVWTMLTK